MQINIIDQNEDTAVMKKKPRIRWWHVLMVFILVILLAFANLLLLLECAFGEKGDFWGELRRYTTFNAEQELKLKRYGYIPPELDNIDITLIKYEYLTQMSHSELHFLIKNDQDAEQYLQYIDKLWTRAEKDEYDTVKFWGSIKDYYIFNWKKYNLIDIYMRSAGVQLAIYMCGDHNMTENRYYIYFTSNWPVEIE